MAVASYVFISLSNDNSGESDSANKERFQTIKIQLAQNSNDKSTGSTTIKMVSIKEVELLLDSINSKILQNQENITLRQTDLLNDIRQETNNNLDKHSAWLAFWITVLGFVGVVSPLGYQMMKSDDLENKIKEAYQNIKKIQEVYTLKMQMLSFESVVANNHTEESPDIRRMYIDSIKRHFKEFMALIENDNKKWDEEKMHIYSVLVNLESFLRSLKRDASYDENRRIQDVIDPICILLHPLTDADSYTQNIKAQLAKINNQFAKI